MRIDAISFHQVAHALHKLSVPVLPQLIDVVIFLIYNSTIHHTTHIGSGTICAYRGMSVLIHKQAVIGKRVSIGPHVVIGGRSGHERLPVIEDDVYLGSNSSILGPITVGRGAVIGAGAVVISDVPARSVAVGVPARIIKHNVGNKETGQ